MKKKFFALLVLVAFALAMVSCGPSAEEKEVIEEYENDMDEIMKVDGRGVEDSSRTKDNMIELIEKMEDLDMETEEGEQFIEAYTEAINKRIEMFELAEAWDLEWEMAGHSTLTIDWIFEKEGRFEELGHKDEASELSWEAYNTFTAFVDAAKEAGVDEEEVSEFDREFFLIR